MHVGTKLGVGNRMIKQSRSTKNINTFLLFILFCKIFRF